MTKVTLKPAQLIGDDKLEERMERWGKSMQAKQAEGHKIACSVLLHFGRHKDVRMVQRFLLLVPDMVRANGLRAWFEAHAAVKFIVNEQSGEETVLYVKDKFGKDKPAVKLGEGMAKPFWQFKAMEGKPYQPLVEDEFVQKAIDRLRKDTAKTGTDHSTLLYALENYKSLPATLPVSPNNDPLTLTDPVA